LKNTRVRLLHLLVSCVLKQGVVSDVNTTACASLVTVSARRVSVDNVPQSTHTFCRLNCCASTPLFMSISLHCSFGTCRGHRYCNNGNQCCLMIQRLKDFYRNVMFIYFTTFFLHCTICVNVMIIITDKITATYFDVSAFCSSGFSGCIVVVSNSFLPSSSTARGGPCPPLQYASWLLGSLLYPSTC
jgi:hypothetical protein